MLKGMNDLTRLLKMQKDLLSAKKKIKKSKIEGISSDGMIQSVIDGEYRIIDIKINSDFIKNTDKEKLEKMIISSVNNAVDKMKKLSVSEIGKLSSAPDISELENYFK